MMDFIKYFDFFTIKFHFYTNNQPKFRNVFGGIMNILYLLICAIIFVGFSYEDLFKLNPISSKSEISYSEQKIVNVNSEKLWIPFRMVTYEEKFIDHRKLLYILPYFVEGKRNDLIGMDLKYHLLHYKLCNETSMVNKSKNYIIDIPLNELFCIEEDDISFGGSWNGDILNYIEINLHLCEDGINFNASDPRCTKMNDLLKFRNTSWLFEFYYPVVQFQPRNLENPLVVIYRSYFYRLNTYTNKVERIYLQEHILSDDKSLIIRKTTNSSCWGMSNLYGDDYFSPNDGYFSPNEIDPIVKGTSSRIYSLDIYMDFGLIYYTREYKKIFLIISNVFPLFRLVLYILKNFTEYAKMSLTKSNLVGLIFENKRKTKMSLFKFRELNQLTDLRNKINIQKNESSKEVIFDKNNNNISSNLHFRSSNNIIDSINNINTNNIKSRFNSNVYLNDVNAIKSVNMNQISAKHPKKSCFLNEPMKLMDSTPKTNNNGIDRLSNSKNVFPYYYYFLDFYFDRLIHPQKFCCINKKYFTVYNFMSQIYDISTHILLFKQFNLMNNSLKKIYEEKGFCPAHPFKKININDGDLMFRISEDLKAEKPIIFTKNLK